MKSILFFTICLLSFNAFSQGCSDAGFCTVYNLKPQNNQHETHNNHLRSGLSVGKADFDISVIAAFLEYRRQLSSSFSVDIRLTQLSQSGNDISTSGLSDLYINAGYKVNSAFSLTGGLKMPLNVSNKLKDGRALPMDYQSSLGTTDLILGAGFVSGSLQFNFAIQQPLSQNDNVFFPTEYPAGSPLREFPATNKFKRSGDVMLRVAYRALSGNKWSVTPAVLPIFHLSNDKFTDTDGIEKEIEGSQGLTLNTNIFVDYKISESFSAQLNAGLPLLVRETRPDGLTRSFIAGVELKYTF
jgi:hypothetical protein